MERKYNVTITETYCYNVSITASSKKEALAKAKAYYANENSDCEDMYVGVADAISHEKTTFKIDKDDSGKLYPEIDFPPKHSIK